MRVGFFGGTFDPPHIGHLAVCQAATEQLALDRVLVVPTGRQPLKPDVPGASFEERLAMVRLLCEHDGAMQASDMEAPAQNGEANYTIDTLQRLRSERADADEIFVIVGADSFRDLRRWRAPDELLQMAQWIVVHRPGVALKELCDSLALTDTQRSRVHFLNDVDVPISATDLRRRLAAGDDCSKLIPQNVLHYIQENNLYQRGSF